MNDEQKKQPIEFQEGWVGREIIVWPKRGESFALCIDHPQDGIVPAVSSSGTDGQQGLVMAPFLKGVLRQFMFDWFVVEYRMPPNGQKFLASINMNVVATVTVSHPDNEKPRPTSSLIVGL